MKTKSFLLILLPLIACKPAVDPEQEAAKLMQADRDFAALALQKGTAEAFRTYFEPEGIQFPNGLSPVRGRQAVYESLKDVPDNYILKWDPELAEVSESGDLGWTWGYYTASYTDSNGEDKKSYGKYLTVWHRQPDGSWLVRADTGNKNPGPKTDN